MFPDWGFRKAGSAHAHSPFYAHGRRDEMCQQADGRPVRFIHRPAFGSLRGPGGKTTMEIALCGRSEAVINADSIFRAAEDYVGEKGS